MGVGQRGEGELYGQAEAVSGNHITLARYRRVQGLSPCGAVFHTDSAPYDMAAGHPQGVASRESG